MNERTFLKRFEESVDRDRLVDQVYDEMVGFCRAEGITEDEISTPELEALAEGFVKRGFGLSPSSQTLESQQQYQSDVWKQLAQAADKTDKSAIELLKDHHDSDEEYEYTFATEELGEASAGDELDNE